MSPEEENDSAPHNPHAPAGNVPGAEGYDPTKEQDVPQSDTSTMQHTEIGGPTGGPEADRDLPKVLNADTAAPSDEPAGTPDFPHITNVDDLTGLEQDLFVTVDPTFAAAHGVNGLAGEVSVAKLTEALRENGYLDTSSTPQTHASEGVDPTDDGSADKGVSERIPADNAQGVDPEKADD